MARLPRLVLPGHPCHVTQRGNRRQQTFFCEEDFALYRDLFNRATYKRYRKAALDSWNNAASAA